MKTLESLALSIAFQFGAWLIILALHPVHFLSSEWWMILVGLVLVSYVINVLFAKIDEIRKGLTKP